ncbi:hypothetical protein COUCH_11355 [Couchioplanes caeruleus]|uniref:hypothetical protein n=1 Tax=Couchioplanes caeruleus TaxID=56438 RepID=UPI0020BEDAF1|nr:hypothetical protein [Couchioplanes caeruleus]UQU66820.1 hypothetical protein COUCH_11355 [Couchioplanes caeruleus]
MNLTALKVCATCGHALTEHQEAGKVAYRHPVVNEQHEVVPVDAGYVGKVFNRCHTCSEEMPVWNYRTGLIGIAAVASGMLQTYSDQWHVCYRCAQFIEADDFDALTAHCAALMHWPPVSEEYTILNTLHRGIVLGRLSRTLLASTEWRAARITADMLPKVRDRLTGLLRGPENLPAPINDHEKRRSLADHLDLVPMYWINQEFTELVNAVSDDQPTARITDDLVPTSAGLVAWPEPVGRRRQLAAVSWTPHGDGWHIIGYRSIGGAVDEDLMPPLRHQIGWLIPIHTEHITKRAALDGSHPLGPLVTTWLLINQQMAQAIPAKLPKNITKAYQRSKRPAPDVRIVRIRPRSTAPTPDRRGTGASRTRAKPDHRFWVSGHERQQAYGPARSLRRPVDIQPFLKGDDHLPIKLSTTVRVLGRSVPERTSDTNP